MTKPERLTIRVIGILVDRAIQGALMKSSFGWLPVRGTNLDTLTHSSPEAPSKSAKSTPLDRRNNAIS